MSVATTIKNQLKERIEACPSVQRVYGFEAMQIDGWPAVICKAGDIEGTFASTSENQRIYSYPTLILFPQGQDMPGLPTGTNRLDYAEDVVSTVIDEIANSIDNNFELDGTPVLFVEAVNAQWGTYEYEGGVAKCALITIRVVTEHNVITNQESNNHV
ncbi:hypothetical protein UFOVP585_39 [uncultured Caudovirales phage]|uniref:Uncharacterized protein n=1 Tax=uncultured Caudovirales phage TaxID=2100421 RepID=A0A6J5MZ60_9CAUD|nr:hypothetical protein UFOVP585_39 [uncultured Caudovirales phage]